MAKCFKLPRRRARVDSESGRSYAELERTVPDYYRFDKDEENAGGFDLDLWAEHNDPTCTTANGGICNTTSMATVCDYGEKTVVNSILPLVPPHRIGGVLITNVKSLDYAVRLYREEMAKRRRQNGLRRAYGIDVSAGYAVGSATSVKTTAPPPRR